MLRYLTVRLAQGAMVIFLISIATFVIMRLMPGDPVMLLLGEGEIRISEEQIEAIKEKWGLNRPQPNCRASPPSQSWPSTTKLTMLGPPSTITAM